MRARRPSRTRLQAWARDGFPRSAGRRAEAEFEDAFAAFTPGVLRKVAAAVERMRELGVARVDAEHFGVGEAPLPARAGGGTDRGW